MEIRLLTLSGGLGPGALTTDPPYFRITSPTGQQQLSRTDSRLGRARFDINEFVASAFSPSPPPSGNTDYGLAAHVF
jgi:hypothetical protein